MRSMWINRMGRKGFTLIELLVVIAIIAMLLSILMPSLGAAKELAGAVVCSAREKQILLAWVLYAQDNDGKLCTPRTSQVNAPTNEYDWVALDPAYVGGSTVEQEIEGIEKGALYQYYEDPKLLHCPMDKRYRSSPANPGFGGEGGYRSFSFVYHANGRTKMPNGNPIGYLITNGTILSASEVFRKLDDLTAPSSKFVLVEDNDNTGFNRHAWVMDLRDPPKFKDPFAVFHGDRSVLGFGDGHVEKIAWRDHRTIKYSQDNAENNQAELTSFDYHTDNEDLIWMQDHYGRNKQ